MAEEETKPPGEWTLAVLEGGVLVGFETVTDELLWVQSATRFPVPNGCDLALKRYKLVEWRPGKWRFDPINHRKDVGAENLTAEIRIVPVLARIVAGAPRADDASLLAEYMSTFDGAM